MRHGSVLVLENDLLRRVNGVRRAELRHSARAATGGQEISRMNSLRVLVSTRMVAVVCCLLLVVFAVQAQQTSGSIAGTVKDKQGAVVPGAKVTLIDQSQATQREQTSSAEGNFTFEALVPS